MLRSGVAHFFFLFFFWVLWAPYRRGRMGVDAVASKPGVAKKCCRSRDGSYACVCSKGGGGVNTTLCRTHELKSGDRRRPETERQGLTPRPSHDSRVASREFVTHRVRYTGTARPNPIIGTPGVVTCASSLRCELHSRLQSPQVTTEDCPKTLLRDSWCLGDLLMRAPSRRVVVPLTYGHTATSEGGKGREA